MKKTVFLLSLFFLNTIVAQEVFVELSRENNIYRGITIPITIAIENTGCEHVYVRSSNAKLSKRNGCDYNLLTNSLHKTLTLSIYKLKNTDTLFIKKKHFRILDLPNPIPTINGQNGGQISEKLFKSNFSLGKFGSYSEYICMNFPIIECTMIVLRNDQYIGVVKNIGHRVTDQTKKTIKLVNSGDIVYFLNIKCKMQDEIRELNYMKFEITD